MKPRRSLSFGERQKRQAEEKGALRDLGRMLRESQVFDMDSDDDELTEKIWIVLSDGRERTAEEIKVKLEPGTELSEISTVLKILENEGKLVSRHLSAAGFAFGSRSYLIKPGATLTINNNKAKRKTLGLNTMAKKVEVNISPDDPIPTAIWKIMCDFRSRKLDEIAELLHQYNFRRDRVRDKVIELRYKGWFTHSGKGNQTVYTLQKTIKIPVEAKVPVTLPVEQKANSTTTQREVTTPKVEMKPVEVKVAPVEVKVEPVVTTPVYIVSKDDSMEAAIWKVMHDHLPMLPSEVGLLLEEFGFKPKSVATRMGVLFNHSGWFDKVPEGKTFRYTLKKEIPLPEKKRETASVDTQLSIPGAEQQTNQETKEDETMSANQNESLLKLNTGAANKEQPAVQNTFVLAESNLLKFNPTIRNTKFSFDQLRLLAKELIAAGYGEGKFSQPSPQGLLVTMHKIRDDNFTDKELDELCEVLKANNLHL